MPKKRNSRSTSRSSRTQCEEGRLQPGHVARTDGQSLTTTTVGCLPILNRLLERMQLEQFLHSNLKPDGPRTRLPTATALLVLVRNLLMSREPIYGVGEWASRYAPDLLGLQPDELEYFNDDRLGRALDRLFASGESDLVMDVVRHVVREFGLSLDEFHNDSTTISFCGTYDDADEEGERQGRKTPAITWGHSKDHRPDLKQLLYVLTITEDGGVPVFFTTRSGNTADDQTHRETWDIVRQLAGRPDFLYVADCKLASTGNLQYIDRQGGRFVTVLPATRKEDRQFRSRLADPDSVTFNYLFDTVDESGDVRDTLRVCSEEMLTKEKFRLWWFHSTRKARRDEAARMNRLERAMQDLTDLRERLIGPRPRLRTKEQVQPAVEKILEDRQVQDWLRVTVQQHDHPRFRKLGPGRPGPNTQYVRESWLHCDLAWELDPEALEEARKYDGVFPLITNATDLTAEAVLRAYRRQPIIEKRFSQLKTDFSVAPVFLKSVSRIQAMLCVYFFSLMLQTLLEREVRQAMEREGVDSLPLYPEGRPCRAPTTRRMIDVFEPVQRHVLEAGGQTHTLTTELTQLQQMLLALLGLSGNDYGSEDYGRQPGQA